MKQLFFYLTFIFLLTSCTGKDGEYGSTDSVSVVVPVGDTAAARSSALANEDSRDYYAYSEIISKPGSKTLITKPTEIFSDSLLKFSTEIPLLVGEQLTIEEYCGTTAKNQWNEPVYKISYRLGSDIEYGYVSQSYIACRLDTLKSKNIIALTLNYITEEDKFLGEITLLNPTGKMIGATSVKLNVSEGGDLPAYTYYFSFKENEAVGLDGIAESFSILTGYDACGYISYKYTFLWDEKNLIMCPETFAVSDAGMYYQHSYLLFSSDSLGKKGSILEIIEGKEYGDLNDEDIEIINKDSTVIDHKWDQKLFAVLAGDTILKKSWTYSVEADY